MSVLCLCITSVLYYFCIPLSLYLCIMIVSPQTAVLGRFFRKFPNLASCRTSSSSCGDLDYDCDVEGEGGFSRFLFWILAVACTMLFGCLAAVEIFMMRLSVSSRGNPFFSLCSFPSVIITTPISNLLFLTQGSNPAKELEDWRNYALFFVIAVSCLLSRFLSWIVVAVACYMFFGFLWRFSARCSSNGTKIR